MIARGDFNLTDSKRFFMSNGHLGAWILMYYMKLEDQLHLRCQLDYVMESHSDIRINEVQTKLQRSPIDEYEEWKIILIELVRKLKDRDNLVVKMSYAYKHEHHAQRGEL